VYTVAAAIAVGVPEIVRVSASNVKPAGNSGVREYVNGGVPPVTNGNTSGSIAQPSSYV
jgi:hypothetical protein